MLHKNPPNNFNPRFNVVWCFVEYDSEILLLLRNKNKIQWNTWWMPAWKQDEWESLEDAMKRELFEETWVVVSKNELKYFDKLYVNHKYDFVYHMFHLKIDKKTEITLNPVEHSEYKWFSGEDALKENLIEDLDECIKMFYNM